MSIRWETAESRYQDVLHRWLVAAACCGILASGSAAVSQEKKKLEVPKPESLHLPARDGLNIACTYFPGGFVRKTEKEVASKPSKEVVPVILLHGFEGNRRELEPLALGLQRAGHAVVTVDLRGHGESRIKLPNGTDLEPSKLLRPHFAMMEADVEAVKKFLLEKNNAGSLNMNLLCLVGADLGGLVATNWIAADWSRQDLPAFVQGKYAKALVVLSPVSSVKGYNAAAAWKHPIFLSPDFSVMLVAGKRDSKSSAEAKQIHNRLEKAHPLPPDENERSARQSLFLIDPDTELSGTKLLDARARLPVVTNSITQFISLRLVNRHTAYPWMERKNPLAGN